MCMKKRQLSLIFHAFSDYLEVQTLCHADDRGRNRSGVRASSDIPNERSIDLELGDRKVSQVAET